jgi:hypothetical protein
MNKSARQTPRVPRTVVFEKVVPAILVILALLLLAVLLIVVLWPAAYAG